MHTLVLVKPDSVQKNVIGAILGRFESEGLRIVALKMFKMDRSTAEKFYSVHADKPFFDELCGWMSSSPIVAAVLEGDNAVEKVRQIIGSTDPAKAEPGTIRALYGTSVGENAVHASDSEDSYRNEVALIFPEGLARQ